MIFFKKDLEKFFNIKRTQLVHYYYPELNLLYVEPWIGCKFYIRSVRRLMEMFLVVEDVRNFEVLETKMVRGGIVLINKN